jgi:hypothetical protein
MHAYSFRKFGRIEIMEFSQSTECTVISDDL